MTYGRRATEESEAERRGAARPGGQCGAGSAYADVLMPAFGRRPPRPADRDDGPAGRGGRRPSRSPRRGAQLGRDRLRHPAQEAGVAGGPRPARRPVAAPGRGRARSPVTGRRGSAGLRAGGDRTGRVGGPLAPGAHVQGRATPASSRGPVPDGRRRPPSRSTRRPPRPRVAPRPAKRSASSDASRKTVPPSTTFSVVGRGHGARDVAGDLVDRLDLAAVALGRPRVQQHSAAGQGGRVIGAAAAACRRAPG